MTKIPFEIGEPVDEPPLPVQESSGPQHWVAVAEMVDKLDGAWLPLGMKGKSRGAINSYQTRIRNGKIKSFAKGEYNTVRRESTLYIRRTNPQNQPKAGER